MMTTRLSVLGSVIAAAMLPLSAAHAWEHIGHAWTPDRQPIYYAIGNPDGEGIFEDSIDDEVDGEPYEIWVTKAGYAQWEGAPCVDLTTTYVGTFDDNFGFRSWDGQNSVTWDDPEDELAAGVLAATVSFPQSLDSGDFAFNKNGRSYWKADDGDIVFNDGVDFATDAQIEAGACSGESSMEGVMTHEQGHLLGLAHSCEEEDICTDPELRDATMYWSGGACSLLQSDINEDDIKSISAIYGPFATFQCSNELDPGNAETIAQGNVPFDLKCIIDTDAEEELTSASWLFGDGGQSEDFAPQHTYADAGNYSIEACFAGEQETCGEWSYCYRRVGYVRACDVPQPEFQIDHVDGLTYLFKNETDVTVYGCIYEIQWDVFKGETLVESIPSWEPEFTFSGEGEYRVVLNIGGPAGTGAAQVSFTAEDQRGDGYGCNTVGGMGGGLLALLAVGAAAMRRRREA
jgi:MYXO-CTERM domain-containing protein